MRTIILVRHNIDWNRMTDADFYAQQRTENHPRLPYSIRALQECRMPEVWRQLFGFEYFRFRHEMKRIAQFFNGEVQGAVHIFGFEQLKPYLDSPEDFFIAPTDDDDIFHPHLARDLAALYEQDPSTKVVSWPQTLLCHGQFVAMSRRQEGCFRTNCYAARKSHLMERLDLNQLQSFLWSHTTCRKFPNLTDDAVRWGKHRSLTHKHLGSSGKLSIMARCDDVNEHGQSGACDQCFRKGLIEAYEQVMKPVPRRHMPAWIKQIVPYIKTVYAQFKSPL